MIIYTPVIKSPYSAPILLSSYVGYKEFGTMWHAIICSGVMEAVSVAHLCDKWCSGTKWLGSQMGECLFALALTCVWFVPRKLHGAEKCTSTNTKIVSYAQKTHWGNGSYIDDISQCILPRIGLGNGLTASSWWAINWANLILTNITDGYIEGILPKGHYPPCLRMTDRVHFGRIASICIIRPHWATAMFPVCYISAPFMALCHNRCCHNQVCQLITLPQENYIIAPCMSNY